MREGEAAGALRGGRRRSPRRGRAVRQEPARVSPLPPRLLHGACHAAGVRGNRAGVLSTERLT